MKLIAQHTIVHDGETYAPGDLLDVKKSADAKRLVQLGAAQPAAPDKPAAADPPQDAAPAEI